MERSALISLLKTFHVPLELWGKGEAKTLDHLLAEVNSGEAALVNEETTLVRLVFGAVLNVYHTADGAEIWRLKEQKQVFRDGRERVRDLNTSIGEKIKTDEEPEAAARRALAEELGIREEVLLLPSDQVTKGPLPSPSFPGLKTKYVMYVFEVFLPAHLYKPEGYVEEQADKTNYYIWEKVS